MSFSPENIVERVKKEVKQNLIAYSTVPIALAVIILGSQFEKINGGDGVARAQERGRLAEEAALRAQSDLTKDYEETAGVDMIRSGDSSSFLFTITRRSAVLAGTREALLGRVVGIVSQKTGCPNIVTLIAWQDNALIMPWDALKPTIYSATAICPK